MKGGRRDRRRSSLRARNLGVLPKPCIAWENVGVAPWAELGHGDCGSGFINGSSCFALCRGSEGLQVLLRGCKIVASPSEGLQVPVSDCQQLSADNR